MMMKKRAAIHRTKQTKGKKKTRLLNTPKKKLSNSHLPGNRRPPSQALLPRPRPRQPALRRLLRRPPRLPAGHRLGGAVQRGLRRREGARRGAAPSHRRRRRLRLWRPLDEAEPADAARGAAGRAGAAVEGVRLREAEGGRGAGAGGRGGKRGRGRGRRSCGRNCGDDSRCSSSFFDRHCHHHDDNHNSNTTTNYFLLLLPPFLPQRLRPPHQRPATPRQPLPQAPAQQDFLLVPGPALQGQELEEADRHPERRGRVCLRFETWRPFIYNHRRRGPREMDGRGARRQPDVPEAVGRGAGRGRGGGLAVLGDGGGAKGGAQRWEDFSGVLREAGGAEGAAGVKGWDENGRERGRNVNRNNPLFFSLF